jgi:hypothetical protein
VVNILHCKFCRFVFCSIDNSKDVQELIYKTCLKIVSKEDFLKYNGNPFTRISGIRTRNVSPNMGSIPTPLLRLLQLLNLLHLVPLVPSHRQLMSQVLEPNRNTQADNRRRSRNRNPDNTPRRER